MMHEVVDLVVDVDVVDVDGDVVDVDVFLADDKLWLLLCTRVAPL